MKFMALGGAEKIGASCYYLEISGTKLLLDCGKGINDGVIYSPNYSNLIIKHEICNLGDIDAILISHGHFDHIGALKDFSNDCKHAKIYMTKLTKKFADLFMVDSCDPYKKIYEDFTINHLMNKITEVSYNKSFYINNVKITFYEAGHIIGACMIYIETNEGNILYTGDFLKEATNLTSGYKLPDDINVDVMIMCATHGKHRKYKTVNNENYIIREVKKSYNKNIFVRVSQLTKGLETLICLRNIFPERKIYIDKFLMDISNRLESAGIDVLTDNCILYDDDVSDKETGMLYDNDISDKETGIYIGFKSPKNVKNKLNRILSLHGSYKDCVELIEKVDSKVVFIVHSEDDHDDFGKNALQREFNNKTILNTMQGHLYRNN